MSTISTAPTEPKDSESSSQSDLCDCDHMRGSHVRLLGGCAMFACQCEGFRFPAPIETCNCGRGKGHHGLDATYCRTCSCEGFTHSADAEPPMTAEEEEQAPEDPYEGEQGNCGHDSSPCVECGMRFPKLSMVRHMREAHPDPREAMGAPVRRPPYAVQYTAGDRAYEALLPGDCTIRLAAGGLLLEHPQGVDALTVVAPVERAS